MIALDRLLLLLLLVVYAQQLDIEYSAQLAVMPS
jgi:hypothetical protein